jgi:hypothetical protein
MNADMLEHFSLSEFAIMGAIYTFLVFMGGRSRRVIFSKSNAVATSTVLSEHLKFLTILLLLMVTVTWLYPKLPEWSKEIWSTGRSGRGAYSGVDFGFLLAMAGMYLVERRRIYVEAETESEGNS